MRAWGPDVIQPEQRTVLVGRGSAAAIDLTHPAVSRRHAELSWSNGKLVVHDLGSRTGTSVNGKRISEQELKEGDRIEFGPVGYEMRGGRLRRLLLSEGLRLEASGLAVERDGRRLLAGVNLTLAPSQFIGILGPSGSGKTTLIKCLAGYLPPAAGELTFDGVELYRSLNSYRLLVGYVPQEDVIYPALTSRENLDFAIRLRIGDLQPAERAELIANTLDQLRLTEHAQKPASVLSGGQRKRLNVAMELLARPRILFLDEPTAGLDPAGETRLMCLLKELAARGVTVVCATHVMENLTFFDQVVVIAEQTSVYSGPPQNLLAHFQVKTYPALYEVLERNLPAKPEQTTTSESKSQVACKVLDGIQLVSTTPPVPENPAPRISLGNQVAVQFFRGLALIRRDKMFLGLLLGQPLLVGLLINLSQLKPTDMSTIFLFAVLTIIWLGLNNVAREVVRDRRIYVRERLIGVTPDGYLLAKVLLFGLVGLVQTLLLVVVIRYANFLTTDDAEKLSICPISGMFLVLWTTYVAAMLLGLLVSTLANSQETAVAALPLIVLPQLLLTGVATGMDSSQDGKFRSLVLLVSEASKASRGLMDWVLELASMPTYSRPAVSLLLDVEVKQMTTQQVVMIVADGLHLLFLLLVTASMLALAFSWRERFWLKE